MGRVSTLTSIEVGRLTTRAATRPDTWNEEARTVEVMWSSGREAMQYSWSVGRFYETLEVTEEACDLSRLNEGANVLAQHGTWSLGSVLGVVERAWIADGKGYAVIRFSEREEVQGTVQDIRDGILHHFSVGYSVRKYRDDTEPDETVKRFTAIEWEPYELSLVSVPAESGAGTRSRAEADTHTHRVEVHARDDMSNFGTGVDSAAGDQGQVGGNAAAPAAAPAGGERHQQAAPAPAPAATPPQAQERAQGPAPVDPAAEAARAVEAERDRVRGIAEHCRALNLSAEATQRLQDTGRQLSELAADVAREYTAAQPADQGEVRSHVSVGDEELNKHRNAAAAALFARMMPQSQQAREGAQEAGEYRARSLMDTVRILEGVHGRDGLRMSNEDTLRRALHTTSDFPTLLEEAGRRTLRAAYELREPTWRPWCREASLMDFRAHDRVRVGDAPELEEVPEGGDVKFGTVGESKETIALKSYAKGVGLDRRAIINDDLGAFARLITSQAQRVSDMVSNLVYSELRNGRVGGSALFLAGKKNLAGVALDVDGIGALEKLMLDQKSEGGMPLSLMPRFLIVPTALKLAAQKLTSEINPTQASEVNPYRGVLEPIVEPRLDNASEFYLVADPSMIDTIEVGWLEGNQGPQFSSAEVFENRGMKFAVWADVTAKAIDFRGMAKSTGA